MQIWLCHNFPGSPVLWDPFMPFKILPCGKFLHINCHDLLPALRAVFPLCMDHVFYVLTPSKYFPNDFSQYLDFLLSRADCPGLFDKHPLSNTSESFASDHWESHTWVLSFHLFSPFLFLYLFVWPPTHSFSLLYMLSRSLPSLPLPLFPPSSSPFFLLLSSPTFNFMNFLYWCYQHKHTSYWVLLVTLIWTGFYSWQLGIG